MTKYLARIVAVSCFAVSTFLLAGTLDDQGKAWLAAHSDPAKVNVTGVWSSEFGDLQLTQAPESREVAGQGGGYQLNGVVSDKTLYILFVTKRGTVDYCGVATSTSDKSFVGEYMNRVSRLHFGADSPCQTKGRALRLIKK